MKRQSVLTAYCWQWLLVVIGLDPSSFAASPQEPKAFLKGQLHLHTNASGDGTLPLAKVVELYQKHGYDFIVVTDHNRLEEIPSFSNLLVLPGVELTQNVRACEPKPLPGKQCLLHMNALLMEPDRALLDAFGRKVEGNSTGLPRRLDLYLRALELTKQLSGLPQLNHPNFHYGADQELVVTISQEARKAPPGVLLLEIANQGRSVNNPGDATHPSTEAMWDAVLKAKEHVFATASDDFHELGEEDLGFVMVRAAKDPASIRAALARGDFYSSTGVLLTRLELAPDRVIVEVAPSQWPAQFEVIGPTGVRIQTSRGSMLSLDPRKLKVPYLRIRVMAHRTYAWTQPVWLPEP